MRSAVCLLAVAVCLAACSSARPETTPPTLPPPIKGEITVGAKSITEQYLLMKMSALLLKDNGYKVNEMEFLDSQAIRSAMEAGETDLYWEYPTTAGMYYHQLQPVYDGDRMFDLVAAADRQKGIVWLPRSDFNSSWCLLMREDLADRLNIRKISELAEYVKNENPRMKFATNDEYKARVDGLARLQKVYEFQLSADQVITVESDLLSQAPQDGRVDVVVGITSDPRIKANHLIILEDDRKVFPPYHAAPVVLERTLNPHPDIRDIMGKLTPYITNDNMLELMYQVDILQKDITNTARNFLVEHRLLEP